MRNFGEPQTSYDFLYFYDFNRDAAKRDPYSVENGRIVQNSTSTPPIWFNINNERKTQLTLDDAKKLNLSAAPISPDGFALESGYHPCGRNAQCPYMALRHLESGRGREIDLQTIEFGGVPHLIGWIVP